MTACKISGPAAAQKAPKGPLDCYIDLFVQGLREQQFSLESVRAQVLHVADLSRWLHASTLNVDERTAAAIDRHCQEQRPGAPLRRGHRAALRRLVAMLREQGVCRDVTPIELSPRQRVEEDFKRFLTVERGLAPATLVNYVPFISQLLMERFGRGSIRLARPRATDIIGFVQRHARDFCSGRTKLMLSALRAFLRHLQLRGDIGAELAAAAVQKGDVVRTFTRHENPIVCNEQTAILRESAAVRPRSIAFRFSRNHSHDGSVGSCLRIRKNRPSLVETSARTSLPPTPTTAIFG
jgi:integrase/recombinase XerD